MAPPSKAAPAPGPPPSESLYPNIEGFIEYAGPEDIAQLFEPVKEGLATLKGPKADHGKKVRQALERTEELLEHLLEVRQRLEGDRKGLK